MKKTVEQLQKSYETYFKLLTKYFGEEVVKKFEDDLGERLSFAPRGMTELEGGYPGAIIDFSIALAKKAKKMPDFSIEQVESLIKVALLHELGKLGDDSHEQYLEQDSLWHQEKLGQRYKYNDECDSMQFLHRTMYFVSKYGFKLNSDEWKALLTSGGFHLEENKFYGKMNHLLSHAFQLCRAMAENEQQGGV